MPTDITVRGYSKREVPMTLKELIFQLWKPRYERKGIRSEFKPVFTRYIGVESLEYNDILKTLVSKAKEDFGHCLVFDREIPMQPNFSLINNVKRDLETMDVTHLSTQDIVMFSDPDLNRIFLTALEYTVNLAIKNEHFPNDYVRNDFITKLLLYTFSYIHPLNLSLDYEGTYKCFYYGNIKQRDIYFLVLLYRMTFDVVYINPLKEEFWDIVDTDHLSEKVFYRTIQEIGSLEGRTAKAHVIQAEESMTVHLEQQLESELYTNSGLYKPWQLRDYHVRQLLMKGNTMDLMQNWNQPAKVRNGFSVKDHEVSIPHFFYRIDGVFSNMEEYRELIELCKADDSCMIVQDPSGLFEVQMSTEDVLQLTFYQLSDGTMDFIKLKEEPFYPFRAYSMETQNLIGEKINELIRNPKILKTTQLARDSLLHLVGVILSMNKRIQRMIDSFDYSSQIPKLVYFLENDTLIDKESSILLAFLNNIGFDIVVFSPAGTSGLESYLDENYLTTIRLERMKYDLTYQDINSKKSKSFFEWLFGN